MLKARIAKVAKKTCQDIKNWFKSNGAHPAVS